MRGPSTTRWLAALIALVASAGAARAQTVPPFSQTFTYPTGHSSTGSFSFNDAAYDTSITFQPLAPPDNDYGVAPITTSLDFSGSSLHWLLSLDLLGPLFLLHSYSPTIQCNAVFRLYGVPIGDTAIVRVRVVSTVAIVRDGSNGLARGRVGLTTNMGSAAHDTSHYFDRAPMTDVDTLDVPVRVLGNNQFLQFQLSMLDHVEMLDSDCPRVDVSADVSFLDVPPGMSVVNAYGYGSVVLDAPPVARPPERLLARARADGRVVTLRGVAPGASGAELAVYDLAGRRLASARAGAAAPGDIEVPIPAALTSGIYFVRCTDTRGVRSARFAFAR